MEESIHFLLRWRGIIEDPGKDWVMNYLWYFDAYIYLDENVLNLEATKFCLPNYDKSNRGRIAYEFPLGSKAKNLHEASEIIMVFKK